MEINEDTIRQDMSEDKKDELEMLKEFEKRRKFKSTIDILKHKEELEGPENPLEYVDDSVRLSKRIEYSKNTEDNPESLEAALAPNKDIGEIFDSSKFHMIFLDSDMVCNMTRLNRVYERRCLVYIGNKDGLISYGIGRGALYEDAYIDAYKQLKKNLIGIHLDPNFSCAMDIKGRFNDFRLEVRSAKTPSFWGNHIMCLMLRYAGLYHIRFIVKSRKKEPYSMIFAFFKVLTKNKTREQTQEIDEFNYDFKTYVGRAKRCERKLSIVSPF
jgi:ribosomal protein S5